jgi:Tfp pilus assembly PilM family ATPase/Tfp pilus assembly protein PilN
MYTALNISCHNIKLLSLKGRRVHAWASVELAAGLVRDGLILQPQKVGEAINTLFMSSGIPRTNVIISMAGLPFTYRFINLPRVKSSLLEEAILRTAKKEISLPLDELYVSWQTIATKGEEQRYFILGVPRNPVDTLIQTLAIANVEPYLMDLQALALARAANRSDAILVNMMQDSFDIVLVSNGLPAVIHSMSPKGESTTPADSIHRLADELTKIAAFNQTNNPDVQLTSTTPLLLTGESANDAMAGDLLQSEIEYPLEPLIPPVEYPNDLPIASYTTCIGLALKNTTIKPSIRGEASHFTDINLNILAGKYRKPKSKPISTRSLLVGILIIAAVIILATLSTMGKQTKTTNDELNTSLNQINREINLATLVNEETLKTEAEITDLNSTTQALIAAKETVLATKGAFFTGLQKVTGVMPAKIYFTLIEMHEDSVMIQGEADSEFTVIAYATALEAQGVFTEVRISSLDETIITVPGSGGADASQVSVITFEIICTN